MAYLSICTLIYKITLHPTFNKDTHTQPSNNKSMGFPGGAVVKNLPANAGDGFKPWPGKIPNAAEQLSPCATTTEPAL